MSSYAVARDYVSKLIKPQAHVRYSAYEPPREPLREQLEYAYAAARLALIGQRLAGEEQGLRLEKLSRY
jgi:hypothetical protein